MNADRSNVLEVGELRLGCVNEGENVWLREPPPPPPLPPPGVAVAGAAADDTRFDCEDDVMVLLLGDNICWLLLACCDPVCKGGKGEVEDVVPGKLLRFCPAPGDEFTTEEKLGRNGEAAVGFRGRLVESELRSVDRGVRPRPAPATEPGRPQAECWVLVNGRTPELLVVLEVMEF